MKRSILPLTILLPLVAAATAAAQMTTLRFGALSPISSLPQILPCPISAPLVGVRLASPSLTPVLTPSARLADFAPLSEELLPLRRRAIPATVVRLAVPAASAAPAAAKPDASKERLDGAFDGESFPSKPVVDLPRRTPVSSGRHISLPEWDLERELGLGL